MKAKVLFLDDIFSERFRNRLPPEHLALDDNWVSSVGQALEGQEEGSDITFELIKNGEIDRWREVVTAEKPDILLLDLFWPEEALARYHDRSRGADVSLEILPKIREAFPRLPIVCYTVKLNKELLEEAYRLGATFVMEKLPLALPEVHKPLKYILIYLLKETKDGR